MNIIPQHVIEKMDPADRASLPLPKKAKLTTSERKAQSETKLEREMHNEFSNYLQMRARIFQFIHANPTKRSTIEVGWPDYTVICKIALAPRPHSKALAEPLKWPVACLIELKVPGGRLTESQIQKFAELEMAGIQVFVCTSSKDAIEQLIEYFEIPVEALSNDD